MSETGPSHENMENESNEHMAAFEDWKAQERVTQINKDGTVELHDDIEAARKAIEESEK